MYMNIELNNQKQKDETKNTKQINERKLVKHYALICKHIYIYIYI